MSKFLIEIFARLLLNVFCSRTVKSVLKWQAENFCEICRTNYLSNTRSNIIFMFGIFCCCSMLFFCCPNILGTTILRCASIVEIFAQQEQAGLYAILFALLMCRIIQYCLLQACAYVIQIKVTMNIDRFIQRQRNRFNLKSKSVKLIECAS